MDYAIGVILFALAILISVAFHEAGHMGTARMFGMRVTRFFIGFGPTLFSFHKGETEYGVKPIPLGAFVKITGMTAQEEEEEEVPPEDQHRVFWRKPVWQRTIVLCAGSVTHFILGFLILWIMVSFVAAPNPAYAKDMETTSKVDVSKCLMTKATQTKCEDGDPKSPAVAAGLESGDEIIAVSGTRIAGRECKVPGSGDQVTPSTWACAVNAIRKLPAGDKADFTISRDGKTKHVPVTPKSVTIDLGNGKSQKVTQIGITQQASTKPASITYGPVAGIGAAGDLTGQMAVQMGEAVTRIPQKVPALWNSIFGAERDQDTPVSVVGASRLGGEMVEHNLWPMFFYLLATLNYFIGVFNLFPLLPMDGGHIAIAWYEKVRSWWAAKRNKPDPGRVDYMKLMPLTYTVIIVMLGFTLLTVTADIVNPITLFK
ncbi:MAG TPA: site-2 protease family protein [Stackebrandtia sp.]|uniref:M50 family metallopeptidase n=1 Tax=Stackebrandtia sp. TaxID=2023065 RepID=UPI002D7370A4|nr:site-2 protease family protein [Stackebrandtia sp.]HZE40705.1 site-2 protease family protein [Stackebrandtia sp.]